MDQFTPKKLSLKQRISNWKALHPRRFRVVMIGLAVGLLISSCAITYIALSLQEIDEPVATKTEVAKPKPKPAPIYSPLTGLKVENEADRTKPVTAIMIENSPESRPQSGLKQAEIVYEAIAEGGITRFMAIYQQNKPEIIGPVRSLRPYYIDWSVPYNASISHSGGSARAIEEIRNGTHRDVGQPTNSNSYYRATDRFAPHNVYTSFDQLDSLNLSKSFNISNPKEMTRGDIEPVTPASASTLSVTISSTLFNSSYTYDIARNAYDRSQGGTAHLDREEGQISPTVIIVLKVAQTTVQEETARQSIETVGSGQAVIFQNGAAIEATWTKATKDSQLKFTDAANAEIALARGQTWITAIPANTGVVSWQ